MQNYVQEGRFLTLPAAPYDLAPGDGALVGNIFGVSANTSESGAECVLGVVGVYSLLKVAVPDAFAVGDPVYWDDTDKVCTTDNTAPNVRIGVATEAAGSGITTVAVRLHGAW